MKSTIKFICSRHKEQELSAFIFGGIILRCGCTWTHVSGQLQNSFTQYKDRFWEQTESERIKFSRCAYHKCKRKVIKRVQGDFWCKVHQNIRRS